MVLRLDEWTDIVMMMTWCADLAFDGVPNG